MFRTQYARPTDFMDGRAYLGRICHMSSIISLRRAIWTSLGVGIFYNTIIPYDVVGQKKEILTY